VFRRHQYKLRFHKWQLSNLRTISENPQSSSCPITTVRNGSTDEHFFAVSKQPPAEKTVPGLDEPSRAELREDSNDGQDIQTSGKRLEGLTSTNGDLGELPMMHHVAGQADVDVSSVTSLTSGSEQDISLISGESLFSAKEPDIDVTSWESFLPESELDVDVDSARRLNTSEAAVGAEEAETTTTDSPAGVDIIPPTKIISFPTTCAASPAIAAKVQTAVQKADVLIVVGCYQQAHKLYSQWWETLQPSYTESADLPFLVSIISNMSRAASIPTDVAVVVAKITELIHLHTEGKVFDPIAECTLQIQLAILHRRHQHFSDAAHHCQCAVLILEIWSAYKSLRHQDWGLLANLIGQYIKTGPENFRTLMGEKWCMPFESLQRNSLKADLQYVGLLRKLFAYCASRLSFPNNCQKLAEGLKAASRPDWDSETMIRALSILLFCQLWEPFACGDHGAQTSLRDEVDWVHNICRGMRIGGPDLFAAIAFVLVDLASPWHTESPKRFGSSSISGWSVEVEDVSLRLFHIPKAAHALVSKEGPQAEFMQSFFIAHAANKITPAPMEISALDTVSHLIERCLRMEIHLQWFDCSDGKGKAQLIAPNDPTLNPTPRSSASSGFRSMKALSRRIAGRGSGSSTSNSNQPEIQSLSIRSSKSWSLRFQMRLSGTSSKTLSSIETESSRGSAMDWEPEVGRIAENDGE
jgi:hypothetical protein